LIHRNSANGMTARKGEDREVGEAIFGISDFRYYAIADGIRELLTRYNRRIVKPIKTLINENLLLFFDS
jgi:hypothetical protein